MSVEIERKFVPVEPPAADVLGSGTSMRQGYLAEEGDVSVRVRIAGRAATLTIKGGGGLARTEVELPLSPEHAEALWPHTVGRRVDKTRHRVALDDDRVEAEVDIYGGELSGLCTVEVEFESVGAANAFRPPAWFGREVTGDVAWSNAALARHGRPG